MLWNLDVIENHDAESLVAVVVILLRGLWLVRICIVVILTTAALLKYNFEGGQSYCVVMASVECTLVFSFIMIKKYEKWILLFILCEACILQTYVSDIKVSEENEQQ